MGADKRPFCLPLGPGGNESTLLNLVPVGRALTILIIITLIIKNSSPKPRVGHPIGPLRPALWFWPCRLPTVKTAHHATEFFFSTYDVIFFNVGSGRYNAGTTIQIHENSKNLLGCAFESSSSKLHIQHNSKLRDRIEVSSSDRIQ